ncbi:hypothetical protein SAMN04488057_12028 [Cyclobacterium lianum]|uniref:Uncharacterized protein n=1 Tax=Cyclobacterium lianum TaxID=388280 RepID=A0A1M7QMM1_9BACT|nr:hypothetical protein SAMN04488057_12028 [Cyclobacterium lianum]
MTAFKDTFRSLNKKYMIGRRINQTKILNFHPLINNSKHIKTL